VDSRWRAKNTGALKWLARRFASGFAEFPRNQKHRGAATTTTRTPALLLFLFGSKNPVTMEAHAKDKESNEEDNAAVVADEAVGEEE
jgi:phosphatidylglycerophosphatase A